PDSCNSCELAEKFASYLLSSEAQQVLMEKNYMYPAVGQPTGEFGKLPKVRFLPAREFDRAKLISLWSEVYRE
ncbi:MAG: hypothetical protein ABL958_04940, partial [Bdellovibrionia bacterium]